ncbi:MAG: citrate synthase [Actinomycetota bacterium]|nr:citrate synthase [Actinomycetota bacterium]MEC9425236.1 citrate synthase [Actinomycetota bacterium]MEC9467089.1 citrate synthase [Actinomycetota bacterium]MED5220246.1 citrate synthase [Actinomycetota bacterium]MED6327727.1 citrate synthase [Actinomycetota bacterium]
MAESITITDNRTGESVEVPLVDGTVSATAWSGLLPGIWFDDPSFSATSGADSSITFLDGGQGLLRYRGYPIEQLAESTSFLEVAHLLVRGELPDGPQLKAWQSEIAESAPIHENFHKRILEGFRDDAHAMGVLVSTIAAMSTFWPDSKDVENPKQRRDEIVRLIAKMPTVAASAYRRSVGLPYVFPDPELDYTSNFLSMMFKTGDSPYVIDPVLRDAMDMLFVLHADHEQNCSTTTARVVGSAHADPYVTVSSAAAALYGPRHGGANEAVLRMLEGIGDFKNVDDFIAGVKAGEQKLMGFGHRVYKNYDPRARIVKDTAHRVFEVTGTNPLLDVALKLEEVALADPYFIDRKLYPNVDFYSGLIYQSMGFPVEMFTVLFAIGRTPGWLAHWDEMLLQNSRIARPRQRYTGPADRDVPDIDVR